MGLVIGVHVFIANVVDDIVMYAVYTCVATRVDVMAHALEDTAVVYTLIFCMGIL